MVGRLTMQQSNNMTRKQCCVYHIGHVTYFEFHDWSLIDTSMKICLFY